MLIICAPYHNRLHRHFCVHAGRWGEAPNVYSYSVFHPFFQQYLHVARTSGFVLATACAVTFAAAALFTGSLRLGAITSIVLSSLLMDMLGAMALCGVQLNAVSLVNLAMGVGIGLEFLVHIAQGFLVAQGTRCGALSVTAWRARLAVHRSRRALKQQAATSLEPQHAPPATSRLDDRLQHGTTAWPQN